MPGSRVDVSSGPSFKEGHEAFKAGDGSSSKQEEEPLEAEAKRFKSCHEVKDAIPPDPEALDVDDLSDDALNSFFSSLNAEVPIFIEACAGCAVRALQLSQLIAPEISIKQRRSWWFLI